MKNVKKRSLTFAVLMIVLFLISFLYISKIAQAENSNNYIIKNVNHKITVLYNGYIIINDTITIMGNSSHREETIETFTIGFPFQYGSYILDCIVNNATVNVNVPFEERLGFYAVEIVFPEPLNITIGKEHTFTVNFILSNDLIRLVDTDKFTLDYPAYPSLPKSAANCTVELELPEGAIDIIIVKGDENIENATKYFKENLSAFTHFPANLTFSLSGDDLQLFEVEELKREIRISGLGEISGSDNFYIVNEMSKEKVNPHTFCIDELDHKIVDYLLHYKGATTPELAEYLKTNRWLILNRLRRIAKLSKRQLGRPIVKYYAGEKSGKKRAWWINEEIMEV